MIRGVNQVVLYVEDQERRQAVLGRHDRLRARRGLAVRRGALAVGAHPGRRRQAGAQQAPARLAAGSERDGLPHSPVFFYADDVEATYRELSAKGVKFPEPPSKQFFGWWSMFEDPDGTRYALGQRWGADA